MSKKEINKLEEEEIEEEEEQEEKIIEIKEDIKEKVETEIPQIISNETKEIVDKIREDNLKASEKDPKQRGPCQKCQCTIF